MRTGSGALVVMASLAGSIALAHADTPLRAPRPTLTAKPAATPTPNAKASAPTEPSWPMAFELLAGERAGGGFGVTRPGPIRVTVQSGATVVLAVRRPDGRVVEKTGSGSLVIDDVATQADVDRSPFWSAVVRAPVDPPRATGMLRAPVALAKVASGSIAVERPPVDAAKLEPAVTQLRSRPRTPPAAGAAPPTAASLQANFDATVAQSQAAELARIRPTLPADASSLLDQRLAARREGKVLPEVASARLAPAPLGKSVITPAPRLTSSSTQEGEPGKPVTLGGTDLGDTPGEVRFIVAAGREVRAPVVRWSATQVVTQVPEVEGLPEFAGGVFVVRADGKRTDQAGFKFIPKYEVTAITMPVTQAGTLFAEIFDMFPKGKVTDSNLPKAGAAQRYVGMSGYVHTDNDLLFGAKGDDEFYLTTRLKNGWIVDSASLALEPPSPKGWAAITDFRPGTDQPYVRVHWWMDPQIVTGSQNVLRYDLRIMLKRPKGLPCPASPCPAL